MRRFIIAVTATVAGLAALLSFKSHSAGLPAATVASSGSGASSSGGSGGSKASSGVSSQQAQVNAIIRRDEPNVPIGAATNLTAGERTVNSGVVQTAYGPVQIQLVEKGTAIRAVRILVQPQTTEHDLQIGAFAFPALIKETLNAQSASIHSVSGATYTSGGYIKSLQGILDKKSG
jgi:uncharacterized protein with FMN-binding domain